MNAPATHPGPAAPADPTRIPRRRGRPARRAGGAVVAAALATLLAGPAAAGDRLAWTGGVAPVEGGAGAGLSPLALIAGLGTEDQVGGAVAVTRVATQDFVLEAQSVAVGVRDRLELSIARQSFDLGEVVPGRSLGQTVYGAKLRVWGDAVFAAHAWAPQVAVGAQWKRRRDDGAIARATGARDGDGVDWYVAATRVFLDAVGGRNALANLTLRRTEANQLGLLGFGGGADRGPRWYPELAVGLFLDERWLLGAEYRRKPDALPGLAEDAAADVFVARRFGKHVTLVAGWVDLGRIAGTPRQQGSYLSVWGGF